MATPITWQNIRNTSNEEALLALVGAQRSLDSGGNTLANLVKEREAVNQGIQNRADNANTQAFLDRLARAKTPEEMAQLQASGELDAMRGNLTAEARGLVRGADEVRAASLQQQVLKNNEFNTAVRSEQNRPVTEQAAQLAAGGQVENLQALQEANPGVPLALHLKAAVDTRLSRQATQADIEHKGAQTLAATSNAASQATQAEASKTSAGAQVERVAVDRIKAEADATEAATRKAIAEATQKRLDDEEAKTLARTRLTTALKGNLYNEGVYKDDDAALLAEMMKKNNIGGTDKDKDAQDKRGKILQRLTEISKKGITLTQKDENGELVPVNVPLPLGAVKAAILGSTDKMLSWNEGYADSFEKILVDKLQATYAKKGPDGKVYAANRTADDHQDYLNILRQTAEVPASTAGAGAKKAK